MPNLIKASLPAHIDINQEIQEWEDAQYGREVRKSSTSAFTKLQSQANAAVDYIIEKGAASDQAVLDVEIVMQAAEAAVDHANDISEEYKQYADDKLTETTEQRQLAETAKQGADSAASLSQSWADGKTGTREGEDSNNSHYFSEQSKAQADRSTTEADRAAQYANITAPGFFVNPETMELYIKAGVGVSFIVTENCEICWKVA